MALTGLGRLDESAAALAEACAIIAVAAEAGVHAAVAGSPTAWAAR
jgi:hypothetical protein